MVKAGMLRKKTHQIPWDFLIKSQTLVRLDEIRHFPEFALDTRCKSKLNGLWNLKWMQLPTDFIWSSGCSKTWCKILIPSLKWGLEGFPSSRSPGWGIPQLPQQMLSQTRKAAKQETTWNGDFEQNWLRKAGEGLCPSRSCQALGGQRSPSSRAVTALTLTRFFGWITMWHGVFCQTWAFLSPAGLSSTADSRVDCVNSEQGQAEHSKCQKKGLPNPYPFMGTRSLPIKTKLLQTN